MSTPALYLEKHLCTQNDVQDDLDYILFGMLTLIDNIGLETHKRFKTARNNDTKTQTYSLQRLQKTRDRSDPRHPQPQSHRSHMITTKIAPQDATWPPMSLSYNMTASQDKFTYICVRFPTPCAPLHCRPMRAIRMPYPTHQPRSHHSCMHMQSAGNNQCRDGALLQTAAIIRDLMHASAKPTTSRDGRKFGSEDGVAWSWLTGVLCNAKSRALERISDVSSSKLEV